MTPRSEEPKKDESTMIVERGLCTLGKGKQGGGKVTQGPVHKKKHTHTNSSGAGKGEVGLCK